MKTKAERSLIPSVLDHTHIDEAARMRGVGVRTFRDLMKQAGLKKAKKFPAKRSTGAVCRRSYVPNWLLNNLLANKPGQKVNGQKPHGGRPPGPDVAKRKKQMFEEWDRGDFGTNKAAAGRKFGFHRPDASKWIREHERAKRRKTSPD